MPDIWMDVDIAIAEAPINIQPLIDDTDFKTIEAAVVYNAAGMALIWHFVTTAGVMTETAVTPTTAGVHDWTDQGASGLYALEIPSSAGTINNDTEGFGWFTGVATGILPWRGPVIGFRAAGLNALLIDDAYSATRGLTGTALPNAVAAAAGGLIISTAGTTDADDCLTATGFATPTNITAGTITTVTNLTNLPAITSNWLTAAGIASSALNGKGDWNVGKTGYTLTTQDWNTVVPDVAGTAATPAEVATALTDIHLDHLLAVNYDPASKPGVATALFNELIENDGGVSRYTANALEQAPGGGGGGGIAVTQQVWVRAKGATSQIIPITIQDSSSATGGKLSGLVYNTASLTAYYNRIGAAGSATAISLVTATKGTWTSSGFIAVDGTNTVGNYELHIPDAALAAGADGVWVSLSGATNMVPVEIYIDLVEEINLDSSGNVNLLAATQASIDAIETDTGTTLDGKINDIQGATFSTSTDSLEAIRDRGDAAWTTGAGGNDRLLMADTTIATLASQTSFTLTAGSSDNDAYNNLSIVIEDVATSTQKAVGTILDYVGSTKTVTLKEALAFTIATTDKVYILAENSLKSTVANRQLDVTATGASGIDWGNVENPTTALDLSGTDIQLVDTTTTNTDMRGTDSANTDTPLTAAGIRSAVGLASANMDTQFTASVTATGFATTAEIADVPTVAEFNARTLAAASYFDPATDTVANVTLVATTTTNTDMVTAAPTVSQIWTTQLTESYAADGTAPTAAQAAFITMQNLQSFSFAGTTQTVKKLDDSTTAATYTLDDATNPTSKTRTT